MMRKLGGALYVLLLIGVTTPSGVQAKQGATRTSSGVWPMTVVVTAAPIYDSTAAVERGGERFPKGAHLLRIEHGKASALVPDFFASADARVSFDGKSILFAGKKRDHEPWQIWERSLADGTTRRVIAADTDVIRPEYLPEGRLVFARRTPAGFQLETAGLDGTHTLRISQTMSNALPVDVMEDGRILFESTYPLGEAGKPDIYLVYPDGSGVESYRCDHGKARWGGHQLRSGDVVFTHGTSLATFTSALATETPVNAPAAIYDGSLAELANGEWVVAAHSVRAERFALMAFHPQTHTLRPIYADNSNNLVEPVLLAPRPTPNRFPSALHPWTTANLLALDVRISRDGALKELPTQVRLETQDAAGHPIQLGYAPIAEDGSFYVHVPGERPLRFSLMDRSGAIVRAERGWFWARSGEQRICVGCHAGPERAPDNRVPKILLHSTIPADLTGIRPASAVGGH